MDGANAAHRCQHDRQTAHVQGLGGVMTEAKYFGKVYTPAWVVGHMLTPMFEESLADVHVCDPACGSGDFLVPIVEEVCKRAIKAPDKDHAKYLATLRQLTGYDIDGTAVRRCRERLSAAVEKGLGQYYPVDFWRIFKADAMDMWLCDTEKFDWVVGNPPYVRIQHLEAKRRDKIRRAGWKYFQGLSDLYIVFFELGLRLLKEGGNLIFISPSGWIRNGAGKAMRKDLEANHGIVSLKDFRDWQVFPGVSTYTCISHIHKGGGIKKEEVFQWDGEAFINSCRLARSASRWAVIALSVDKANEEGSVKKLSEIADIHVGIQTLADKVFILQVVRWVEGFVFVEANDTRFPLEKGAVRRILKASVLKDGKDRVNRVAIYPYDNKGKLIPEDEFEDKFPCAYAWLVVNKDRLLARDKGTFSESKWFGYGRKVGILSALGYKILTSSMNPKPNFQICDDPKALFYSGYCIKPRRSTSVDLKILQEDLEKLQKELNSPAMAQHVRAFSQPFRGGWYSYAKRYIQDFPIGVPLAST